MTIEQSYFNKSVEFDKQWLELCHLLTVLISQGKNLVKMLSKQKQLYNKHIALDKFLPV